MDSLKIPKGSSAGSSKSTISSMPIAIRFNANEESVEDISETLPQSSLSNSPQQQQNPVDEFNWRKEFLQGGFFNRKRSGSIGENERPTSAVATEKQTSILGNNKDSGTWQLIKGKVSQAMEDIKSSKSQQSQQSISSNKSDINDDSDLDNATINSSISDELSLDLVQEKFPIISQALNLSTATTTSATSSTKSSPQKLFSFGRSKTTVIPTPPPPVSRITNDSDSDIDPDILTPDELGSASSASTIRKSLANLRSKAKNLNTNANNAEQPSTIRSTFLRKRNKASPTETTNTAPAVKALASKSSTQQGIAMPKKNFEVESGVEMFEDTMLQSALEEKKDDMHEDKEGLRMSISNDRITFKNRNVTSNTLTKTTTTTNLTTTKPTNLIENIQSSVPNFLLQSNQKKDKTSIFSKALKNIHAIFALLLVLALVLLQIPDFFRGILACLLIIIIFNKSWELLNRWIINYIESSSGDGGRAERSKFQLPIYSKMDILEIPIEEHKSLKNYSGWMNEINNYDPNNYHISMTRSVFIRLDGSILRISNTTTRVPKRSIWNEPKIDKKNIVFTRNRCFNLLGCRVEMLPRGLARKRYFSRKYPMQLIIKTSDNQVYSENEKNTNKSDNCFSKPSEKIESNTPDSDLILNDGSNEDASFLNTKDYKDLDFGATILNSDLQKLQENQDPSTTKETIPCGDEIRVLLFARCDREKEDWYRRFYSASAGAVIDEELKIPDIVMITEDEIEQAVKATSARNSVDSEPQEAINLAITAESAAKKIVNKEKYLNNNNSTNDDPEYEDSNNGITLQQKRDSKQFGCQSSTDSEQNEGYEGLLLASCSARNPPEYVKFMSRYQKACNQSKVPVIKKSLVPKDGGSDRKKRRQKVKEDELWKGIDQSLYLGPSGSVVWANVLIGRILFSCLNDIILLEKIQEFLQKKLSAIRLPGFMEDVSIAHIHLGDTPPLVHRVSQPLLDERGTWVDADVTYEGLIKFEITTKLNLLRLKRSQHHHRAGTPNGNPLAFETGSTGNLSSLGTPNVEKKSVLINNGGGAEIFGGNQNDMASTTTGDMDFKDDLITNSAIYDSDAESSGATSSESDSPNNSSIDAIGTLTGGMPDAQQLSSAPGSSRRLLRIVDRITASNLFQSATEISYIQRAMENMSTKITLRVDLKGLVSRVVVNVPPPPSDRIWLAFRGPPRLWITAKPAVGEHQFDWSIVTNVIENKLCDEVYKYLVYPNMVDIIVPFLGQSTYKE